MYLTRNCNPRRGVFYILAVFLLSFHVQNHIASAGTPTPSLESNYTDTNSAGYNYEGTSRESPTDSSYTEMNIDSKTAA